MPEEPIFDPELEQPQMGGCWVRQIDGSLALDPTEPRPPGMPPEPEPE